MNAPAKTARAASPYGNFSDVGYAEALARARELIPLLKAHAEESEKTTYMPKAVEEALHRSGLFRMQQPRMFGGMELDFPAHYEITEMLGRGDASASWTFINLASHHRQLAQWDPQAQEDIWAENPDALIASGIAYIQGEARRVDGGLALSGQWGFSSGVDVSQWNMLACVVKEDGKAVDWCMCLVPRSEFEIVDDWQTLGMRGTGSRTVKCKDTFVPQHRALSMHVARPGHEFPGLRLHTNPMFRVPTSAMGGYGIGGCMIGNARAMLQESVDWIRSRSTSYTAMKMRDLPTVQLRIGMAAAKIDAADAWLKRDCVEVSELYKSGGRLDTEAKLRYKRNSAVGVKLAHEAVDALHELAGANGIYDKYSIQRMFRDAHAAAGHFSFSTDAMLTPWGLVALGGEVKNPTL